MVIVDINNGKVRREFEAVRTEFGRVPNVKKVGTSSRVPGEWKNITEIVARSTDRTDSIQAYYMAFDEYMLDVYNFEIVSGQNFEGLRSADSTNIILNEQAAEMLGLGVDPIGRRIRINSVDETEFTVIGVLKDFNYQSLHQTINPLIIGYWNSPVRVIDYFSILISGNDIDATIKGLTSVHESFDLFSPIEYHFLDSQTQSFPYIVRNLEC